MNSRKRHFQTTAWSKRLSLLSLILAWALVTPAFSQDAPRQGESETERVTGGGTAPDQGQRPSPKTDGLEVGATDPAEDEVKVLVDDISKNMKKIEELLNQKESGQSTQGLQQDTLGKIDKLIEIAGKT